LQIDKLTRQHRKIPAIGALKANFYGKEGLFWTKQGRVTFSVLNRKDPRYKTTF